MKMFWIDKKRDIKKSYQDLISDLNQKTGFKKYVLEANPYKVYVEIIYSLLAGKSIELLDHDFSEAEMKSLGIDVKTLYEEDTEDSLNIRDIADLFKRIEHNAEKWDLTMYTSGTTGRPKKIKHRFHSITRAVRVSEKHSEDIWAFAYNPTHFAGLQVFFQAFMNKNTIIYLFDSDRNQLSEIILENEITNISATPTFYRTAVMYLKEEIACVKNLTLGGEKYDELLGSKLHSVFPHAKITNIYASTEAGSIFSGTGEVFKIRENTRHLVKISEHNELLIHNTLLGTSDEFKLEDEWYHTGDLVELIGNNEIRFVSRKNEMINIGGYKVNPHEVEDEIKKIYGVLDVAIKPRSNRITGNILVAEIVKELNVDGKELELSIRNGLVSKIQSWKIPRIIKFVDEVEKSRTGKKVRA